MTGETTGAVVEIKSSPGRERETGLAVAGALAVGVTGGAMPPIWWFWPAIATELKDRGEDSPLKRGD